MGKNFKGLRNRINRTQYLFTRFIILAFYAAYFVVFIPLIANATLPFTIGSFLFVALAITIVLSAVLFGYEIYWAVWRFHDLGRSGWWAILSFIPYLNFVTWLFLLFLKGNKGLNKYGEEPGRVTIKSLFGY